MKTPIIKVSNLTKTYSVKVPQGFLKDAFTPKFKQFTAVGNLSFSINQGESVALLGPNGAGKTTTMKMLTGLLYPTEGNIRVLGEFPFNRKHEFLKKIGLVMGNRSGLSWDLSANQNFELLKEIYQIGQNKFQDRVKLLSEMLEVADLLDRQVRKLSLGERMKFELMACILHDPDIIFLDEPTIGLDVVSKQNVRTFLRQIQKQTGVTVVLTSHDMDDVEKVCDRVMIINHGKLMFDGEMDVLLKKYKDKKYLTIVLESKHPIKSIEKYGKIIESKPLKFTIEIPKTSQSQIISEILKDLPVDDIDIVHVPLEEIITDMFARKD